MTRKDCLTEIVTKGIQAFLAYHFPDLEYFFFWNRIKDYETDFIQPRNQDIEIDLKNNKTDFKHKKIEIHKKKYKYLNKDIYLTVIYIAIYIL